MKTKMIFLLITKLGFFIKDDSLFQIMKEKSEALPLLRTIELQILGFAVSLTLVFADKDGFRKDFIYAMIDLK